MICVYHYVVAATCVYYNYKQYIVSHCLLILVSKGKYCNKIPYYWTSELRWNVFLWELYRVFPLSLPPSVSECVCVCVCVCVRVFVWMHVCLCVCVGECLCGYHILCLLTFLYVPVCAWTHVSICKWATLFKKSIIVIISSE